MSISQAVMTYPFSEEIEKRVIFILNDRIQKNYKTKNIKSLNKLKRKWRNIKYATSIPAFVRTHPVDIVSSMVTSHDKYDQTIKDLMDKRYSVRDLCEIIDRRRLTTETNHSATTLHDALQNKKQHNSEGGVCSCTVDQSISHQHGILGIVKQAANEVRMKCEMLQRVKAMSVAIPSSVLLHKTKPVMKSHRLQTATHNYTQPDDYEGAVLHDVTSLSQFPGFSSKE